MTEAELALKFIDHFAEFDIYKEVPGGGGIIDVVAVKSGIRTAIEVKINLSFDVMHQAFQSKVQNHFAYAAVPVKHWRLHPAQEALCLHYGIGVLGCMALSNVKGHDIKTIEKYNLPTHEIREIIKPQLNRHPRKIYLHDYMKRSQAGSQSNRMTAFGYFVECFTTVVAKNLHGIDVKSAFDQMEFRHYQTISSFKNNVVLYCRTGVIKNIVFEAGKFHYRKPQQAEDESLLK